MNWSKPQFTTTTCSTSLNLIRLNIVKWILIIRYMQSNWYTFIPNELFCSWRGRRYQENKQIVQLKLIIKIIELWIRGKFAYSLHCSSELFPFYIIKNTI